MRIKLRVWLLKLKLRLVRIGFLAGRNLGIDVYRLIPMNLLWRMQKYFATGDNQIVYSANDTWAGNITITTVPNGLRLSWPLVRTFRAAVDLFGIELFTTIDADISTEIRLLIAGAAGRAELPDVHYRGEFEYYVGYLDGIGYIFKFDRRGQV